MDRKSLEKELATTVAKEKERRDVDEMKKRAITTAKSYDEFKNMVACASLRPISSSDLTSKASVSSNRMIHGLGMVGKGGFLDDDTGYSGADKVAAAAASAALASKRSASGGAGGTASAAAALPPIRNVGEFDREWRRRPRDPASRFAFLAALGPAKMTSIFRSEIDAMLLGDIIHSLGSAVAAEAARKESLAGAPDTSAAITGAGGSDAAATAPSDAGEGAGAAASDLPASAAATGAQLLLAVSRASMFSMAAELLSAEDKAAVAAIARALPPAEASVAAELTAAYKLK